MLLAEVFEDKFASVSLVGANGKRGDIGKVFSASSYVGFYFHHENGVSPSVSPDSAIYGQSQQSSCQVFVGQARALLENLQNGSAGNGSNAKKAKSTCDRGESSRLAIILVVVEKIADDCQVVTSKCIVERDISDDFVWILPAAERQANMHLLQTFKVRCSPAFIIVDAKTKRTIATDGRRAILTDPMGRLFPWHLPEPEDIFQGRLIKRMHGNGNGGVDFSELRGVVKCLLFAAHWCPPCRLFVKQLAHTYRQMKESNVNQGRQIKFEVIFCSLDRCEDTFNQFFESMPWLAFPYNDPRCIAATRLYNVQEIPSLLLLDPDNQLITKHAKCELAMDPAGQEFPWYPKVVLELNGFTAYRLREEISLLLFTEGTPEDLVFAQTSLLPVAEDFCGGTGADQQDMLFFYCGDDPVCDQMWENFSLGDASLPLICIIDPFTSSLYVCDDANVSEVIIRRFIDKFFTGDLEPSKRLVPLRTLVENKDTSGLNSPQPPNSAGHDCAHAIATSQSGRENVPGADHVTAVLYAGSGAVDSSRTLKRYCL